MFADGGTQFGCQLSQSAYDGFVVDAMVIVRIAPGHEDDWSSIIFTNSDITEHKRAEEALRKSETRYRDLFEHLPIAIWEKDYSAVKTMIDDLKGKDVRDFSLYFDQHPDMVRDMVAAIKILNVNQAALDLYCAASKDEFFRFMNGSEGRVAQVDFPAREFAALAAGETHFGSEDVVRTLDGTDIVAYSITHIDDAHKDDWSHVITSEEDVTMRKQTEDALITAKEHADFANRTKSEFLANMSHELRTPLNAIIGFSEVMKDGMFGPIGSPKYAEYVKDINASGAHLLELINDILDLSKIEAGKTELNDEIVDVMRVLKSCLTLVKERAQAGGLELSCDAASNLPALYIDERKLKQILINLLSNAIKFTPTGGKVTIRIWSHSDDGYVFQVADTGIGIALIDIPKALAPFSQIDSDLNRKYDGTGLGLPLTKALAELHGGSLDLQSEVGVGTTVTVRFPAERIVSETANASTAAQNESSAAE
ncbi:MAG: PAS domain-containing sensor histidine kinase [Alphaproteobacteria bacterium]